MGKVNLLVKYCLINEKKEYNIKGILLDNKLKYIYDNSSIVIDLNESKLEKDNKESNILLDFSLEKCIFLSKNNYQELVFPIKIQENEITKNRFYVKYKIENDVFEIDIKIL